MAEFFSFFVDNLKSFNFLTDTLDILLVTYLIYLAIKFLRQTRAAPLIKGLLFVFGVTLFANLLKMNVTSFIISSLLEFGILALIIIFQPELPLNTCMTIVQMPVVVLWHNQQSASQPAEN